MQHTEKGYSAALFVTKNGTKTGHIKRSHSLPAL
jgi:hypothetical protein